MAGGASHTPKIAHLLGNVFSEKTAILAPSTSTTAINPSELAARGAAIQASLIQEFDKEDIEQSIHPMVTATPHLRNALGVEFSSSSSTASDGTTVEFCPLISAETALPARRVAQFSGPKEGGDMFLRVCEGIRHVKVTKPETTTTAKDVRKGDDDDEDGSDFDDDDDDDDEEETREIVWKTEKPIAEIAVKGVKAGNKVEVMIHVNADLGLQITARELGGQSAVRGVVDAPASAENGSA